MKKILIIDDEVVRRDLFSQIVQKNNEYEVDMASTFAAAKSKITSNTYDVIFLDHDLGSTNDREDGYELAKILATTSNSNAVVLVVSLNPVGANNILATLPNAIPCPAYLVVERWDSIEKEFING